MPGSWREEKDIGEEGWVPDKSMTRFHVGHIQQLFSLLVLKMQRV